MLASILGKDRVDFQPSASQSWSKNVTSKKERRELSAFMCCVSYQPSVSAAATIKHATIDV